jgi:iron complex transport system substrate-binding protein
MRVVSLACSNTEIVHALGCAHLLVGVDSHSDHPADLLEGLPRLGPDLEIDVAKVAALAPDLVLASLTVPGHETVVEGLELAGLPVLTLAPEGLADVPPSVERVAEALGVPERGAALARQLRRAFRLPDPGPHAGEGAPGAGTDPYTGASDAGADPDAAHLHPGASSPRPRILVQWWPKPVIAPGARSWVHGLIELAGGRNALEGEDRLSRPLTDDEVARLAPDAIVISWCGVHPDKYRPDVVLGNAAFADTPALVHGQVHCIPEAFLGRPGPRLLEGLEALGQVVEAVRSASSPQR